MRQRHPKLYADPPPALRRRGARLHTAGSVGQLGRRPLPTDKRSAQVLELLGEARDSGLLVLDAARLLFVGHELAVAGVPLSDDRQGVRPLRQQIAPLAADAGAAH